MIVKLLDLTVGPRAEAVLCGGEAELDHIEHVGVEHSSLPMVNLIRWWSGGVPSSLFHDSGNLRAWWEGGRRACPPALSRGSMVYEVVTGVAT